MVEVYVLALDVDTTRFLPLLSADEQERAARFRFEIHRNRYTVARGMLREVLGSQLGVAPEALMFTYGSHGKPSLVDSDLQFNVSHSHDAGMIAVARGREVGCDIERIEPKFADDQIPERFFSPNEVAALRLLPKADQHRAFFRIWTRKEAFIKACGLGMSLPLDSFDVTLGDEALLLHGADGWSVRAVEAPRGYEAAVVARGGEFNVILK
jgi:4'-phosphopantetheinyl transferase